MTFTFTVTFFPSNHFVPLNSPLMVALEISKLDLCSLKPHAGSPGVQVMRKTWKSQTNKLSPLCSAGSCWLATLVWKSLTQQCLCWRPCGMRIIYSGCAFTVCVCVFTAVCVHFEWVNCRAQIHVWSPYLDVCHVTFTFTHKHIPTGPRERTRACWVERVLCLHKHS